MSTQKLNIKQKAKISIKVMLIAVLLLPWYVGITGCNNKKGSSGTSGSVAAVAEVGYNEYKTYGSGTGGQKYKSFMGWGADSGNAWCAAFVSWCANEAGLTDEGYAPKTGLVKNFTDFYEENPDKGTAKSPSETTPVSGDFVCWGTSHIGIVYSYDAEADEIQVVEGNYNNALHFGKYAAKGSGITHYLHPAKGGTSSRTSGFGCSSSSSSGTLGSGETIVLPDGLGRTKSFMGWSTITSPSSSQYKLRENAGEKYDENGFAKIGDRYVIACTLKYGNVGDYIDWQLENGEVIHSIIGDIKSYGDDGINEWGHNQGDCVIEFVVNKEGWYNCGPNNPNGSGDPSAVYHTNEWYRQAVTKAVNCGNFYSGDSPTVSSSRTDVFGCSSNISNSSGEGQTLANASERGKAIYNATQTVPTTEGGYCAMWVSKVYEAAGCGYPTGNANDMYWNYCKSENRNDLEVGMIVAVPSNSQGDAGRTYGHVGIYIGDGNVISSIGYLKTETLDSFCSWNETNGYKVKWGWAC